uniref:hypothetical protein n=1 Tax=Rhodococcus qingshengii TaxID=334542 RepID=UPI001C4E134B|nr:hypothetical protein [Rhodococcus qingshengii]
MAKLLINPAVGGNSDYYGTFINTTNFFSGNVFKGLNVTQTASASMAVVVNPGSGLIREGTFPGQIGYHVAIDTVGGETVTIATANVSNPRIDAIVGYIDKSVTVPSGTNNTNIYKLAAVAGTPGVSPVAPTDAQIKAAIGAANPYDTYATILVGTGVSQVDSSKITDRRNTAIGKMSEAVAATLFSRSVDANGWTVIDMGVYKKYLFQKSYNSPFAMPVGQLAIDSQPLPVGLTDFRTKNVRITTATSNAAVVTGGYIGGATPDFNIINVYLYNTTGSGMTLNFWYFSIELTV